MSKYIPDSLMKEARAMSIYELTITLSAVITAMKEKLGVQLTTRSLEAILRVLAEEVDG